MSLDREQIDAIKAHFARQLSAKLCEILESNDSEKWSPEAFVAAREVLDDRAVGRAAEPSEPEQELTPLSSLWLEPSVPWAFGLLVGFGPVTAINWTLREFRRSAEQFQGDAPVGFGPGLAWLALSTCDVERVAELLGLRSTQRAGWAEGVAAAQRERVFVTPPLGDWTLAAGRTFFPPKHPVAFVKPLLEFLSERFGEAQYFCTAREVGLHAWARARRGQLLRGFAWLGQREQKLWDAGSPSAEERELGFRFVDTSPVTVPRDGDRLTPTEECVMELASVWSIDPTSLDGQFADPLATGLLGDPPWIEKSGSE